MAVASLLSSDMLVLFPTLLIVYILNVRLGLPAKLLLGLRRYYLPASGVVPAPPPPSRQPRKASTPSREASTLDESLVVSRVSQRDAWSLPHFSSLEGLSFAALSAATSTVLCALFPGAFAPRGFNPTPGALSLATWAGAQAALFSADLRGPGTSAEDWVVALAFGVGGVGAAAAVLSRQPLWASPTRAVARAAAQLAPLAQGMLRARFPGVELVQDVAASLPAVSPGQLRAALALALAPTTALLFLPALRFARALKLQRDPPGWAGGQLGIRWGQGAALLAQMVLCLGASMLWGKFSLRIMLGWTPAEEAAGLAGVLATVGVLFLLNTRTVAQRYFDLGLISWYNDRHVPAPAQKKAEAVPEATGTSRKGKDKAARSPGPSAPSAPSAPQQTPTQYRALSERGAKMLQTKLEVLNALGGRTAVQAAAPGFMLLALGLLLAQGAVWPRISAHSDANLLLYTLVGFAAWWTAAAYFLFVCVNMWIFRTGDYK